MVVNVEHMSNMFGKDVFTNRGTYCGKVNNIELNLKKFRVRSLVIEAARGSYLAQIVGGKKGVIVPYQMIQSIGDIVIIKHITSPGVKEGEELEEEEIEETEAEEESEVEAKGLPF